MTIHPVKRLKDQFDVSCGGCGTVERFASRGFAHLIETIKREGWKIGKSDVGTWTHICPTCVAENSPPVMGRQWA